MWYARHIAVGYKCIVCSLLLAERKGNKMWQKRHALQVAAQLPDDEEDGLLILKLAREIYQQVHLLDAPTKEAIVLTLMPKEA